MYVNCFALGESIFSSDENEDVDAKTFVYNTRWDVDRGGETQFVVDGSLYGIPPIQNRLVGFPASILHRATTFRNGYRFTVG